MKYNESTFFKNDVVYTFISPFGREFNSKVEYYNGSWFTTNESLNKYKATILKSKINEGN